MNTFGASDPNYMLGLTKSVTDEEEQYEYEYDIISTEKTEDSSDFEIINEQSPVTPIKHLTINTDAPFDRPNAIQAQQSSESFATSTEEQALLFKSIDRSFSNIQQKLSVIPEKASPQSLSKVARDFGIQLNTSESDDDYHDTSDDELNKELEWDDILLGIQKQKEYLFSFVEEQLKQRIVNKERIKRAKKARSLSRSKLLNRYSTNTSQLEIQKGDLNNLSRRKSAPKNITEKSFNNSRKKLSQSNQSFKIISMHEENSSDQDESESQMIGLSNPNKTMTIDEL